MSRLKLKRDNNKQQEMAKNVNYVAKPEAGMPSRFANEKCKNYSISFENAETRHFQNELSEL